MSIFVDSSWREVLSLRVTLICCSCSLILMIGTSVPVLRMCHSEHFNVTLRSIHEP